MMEVFEDSLTLKADMSAGEPERITFSSIISIITNEEKVPALFGRPFAISQGLPFWRILIDTNIGTHWELDVGLMRAVYSVSNAYDQWKKMPVTRPEGGSPSPPG